MFDDNEGPKDWELKDEEPPQRLQKKWDREETAEPKLIVCSSCKKEAPAKNLTCIFCGAALSHESGPVTYFLSRFKRLFKRS